MNYKNGLSTKETLNSTECSNRGHFRQLAKLNSQKPFLLEDIKKK